MVCNLANLLMTILKTFPTGLASYDFLPDTNSLQFETKQNNEQKTFSELRICNETFACMQIRNSDEWLCKALICWLLQTTAEKLNRRAPILSCERCPIKHR